MTVNKKVIVGPGRLSFAHIFKPKANDEGKERFETAFLLPPTYDTKPILEALTQAAIDTFGVDRAKWPKGSGFRKPEDVIKKAEDSDYYPGFEGWHVINAASNDAPGVIDANCDDVSDPKQAYAGRWARLSINAYGYTAGKKGVTLGLNNVQLLKNDTPIAGGKVPAKSDFDAVAEDMGAGEEAFD